MPTLITPTQNMPEWLEARKSGLGASESAAVLGVSKWSTALEVYYRKRGELPDIEENEAMQWGHRLEPILKEQLARHVEPRLGGFAIWNMNDGAYRSDSFHWLCASPDIAFDLCDPIRTELGEIKVTATDIDLGPEGSDQVRNEWFIQAQHQMAVMDAERVYFGVLIGGIQFRVYVVERHPELIDILIERTRQFWEMVQNGTPPEPSWTHETTPQVLAAIGWEPDEEEPVDDEEIRDIWDEYETLGGMISDLERQKKEKRAEVEKLLGNHNRALLGDGKILRRKLIVPKPPTEIPKPRSPYFDLRKVNE